MSGFLEQVRVRVGSRAADAIREQYESEVAERDQRLRSLAGQLEQAEGTIAQVQQQSATYSDQLAQAKIYASKAVGELQQIGREG